MNSCGSLEHKELSKLYLRWLIATVLNIATCSRAHGGACPYPDFERQLNSYIGQHKEYHFSVVYTQCLDITSNGRVVLVFPLTIYKSLDLPDQRDPIFDRDFEQWPGIPVMLDYDFNGCIDNVAKLQVLQKGFLYIRSTDRWHGDGRPPGEANEQNNKEALSNALLATR